MKPPSGPLMKLPLATTVALPWCVTVKVSPVSAGKPLPLMKTSSGALNCSMGTLAAGVSRRDLTGARLPRGADPACAASDPPTFNAVNGAASASATSVTT